MALLKKRPRISADGTIGVSDARRFVSAITAAQRLCKNPALIADLAELKQWLSKQAGLPAPPIVEQEG